MMHKVRESYYYVFNFLYNSLHKLKKNISLLNNELHNSAAISTFSQQTYRMGQSPKAHTSAFNANSSI